MENAATSSAQAPITGEDVLIEIGGKNTLAAFNEALRGAKPGQELKFEVDYPADFGERRLAGQTRELRRDGEGDQEEDLIRSATRSLPSSWATMRAGRSLRPSFANMRPTARRARWTIGAKDKLLGELIARFQFPVPESFVQQQIEARLDRGLRALAQQGMPVEDMRKLDFVRLREAQRDQAINEVKASMILDRIAEAEGVTVSEEDLDRELLMLSIQSREPLEALRERLTQGRRVGSDSRADAARKDRKRAL